MRNPITAFVAAVTEAWGELRVNRGRVIVSLIGVVVAVAALTAAVALGNIVEQVNREQNERWGGRAATLALNAYSESGQPLDPAEVTEAVTEAAERYDIGHLSRRTWPQVRVQLPDGVVDISASAVDPQYNIIFRTTILGGRWFAEGDGRAIAPRVLINRGFWERIGSPDLRTNPTLNLLAPKPVTVLVIGVTDTPGMDSSYLELTMLADDVPKLVSSDQLAWLNFEYYLWVPPAEASALMERLIADVTSALPPGTVVNGDRRDFQGAQGEDPFLQMRIVLGALSGLVLFLGALGLVNVALVTVRQRIREIGIRRAIGATGGRVFFVAVAESVVATMLAGALGVMITALLYQLPEVRAALGGMGPGIGGALVLQDFPPFPATAALIGFLAATGVGALTGLIPALVATRVKVIDAIRF